MNQENRKTIAFEAASLGRRTRLNEEVVESVAKGSHDKDEWKVKRASRTAILKSSFHRCIHEAAAVGLLSRTKRSTEELISSPSIILSSQVTAQENGDEDQVGRHRAVELIEAYIKVSKSEKTRRWKSSIGRLEKLKKEEHVQQTWQEHDNSLSGTAELTSPSLLLPSPVVPRWRKRFSGMSKEKLIECISQQAARDAFDRAWRLENETQQGLIVRKECSCVYCSHNPSPYQTQEYQRLQNCDPSQLPFLVNLNGDELPSLEVLPLLETPSLTTIYGPSFTLSKDFRSIKTAKTQIISQVATEAWNRTFRLQKKGQPHVVRDQCHCRYCRTASPAQTRRYQRREQHQKSYPRLHQLGSEEKMKDTQESRLIPFLPVSLDPSLIQKSNDREPHLLTPSPRPPKSSNTYKRCSSTPNPCSRGSIRSTTKDSNSGIVSPPSWVSPLANRKRINYNHVNPKQSFQVTPRTNKKIATPPSPAGVECFITAPTVFAFSDTFSLSPLFKTNLDADLDEEQLLREELL